MFCDYEFISEANQFYFRFRLEEVNVLVCFDIFFDFKFKKVGFLPFLTNLHVPKSLES